MDSLQSGRFRDLLNVILSGSEETAIEIADSVENAKGCGLAEHLLFWSMATDSSDLSRVKV